MDSLMNEKPKKPSDQRGLDQSRAATSSCPRLYEVRRKVVPLN